MQTTEKRISPRKPATVAVAAKPAKKTRTAVTATVARPQSALSVTSGAVQKFFVFVEGARPGSGERLKAHTNAVLSFLGLADKKKATRQAVIALLGVRAVDYHTSCGHLTVDKGLVVLTAKGATFFKKRVDDGKVDADLHKAFLAAIAKGKTNVAAHILPQHLEAVSMTVR